MGCFHVRELNKLHQWVSLMTAPDICVDKCLSLSTSLVGKGQGCLLYLEMAQWLTLKQWKITRGRCTAHSVPYCLSLHHVFTQWRQWDVVSEAILVWRSKPIKIIYPLVLYEQLPLTPITYLMHKCYAMLRGLQSCMENSWKRRSGCEKELLHNTTYEARAQQAPLCTKNIRPHKQHRSVNPATKQGKGFIGVAKQLAIKILNCSNNHFASSSWHRCRVWRDFNPIYGFQGAI